MRASSLRRPSTGEPQVEHLIRCQPSPYQRALNGLLHKQLRSINLKGVRISNTLMELRCISNHPLIRQGTRALPLAGILGPELSISSR